MLFAKLVIGIDFENKIKNSILIILRLGLLEISDVLT